MNSNSPILITGGLGFIGQAIAARFLGQGRAVRILDNVSNASVEPDTARDAGAELHIGDVRDMDACAAAVDGVGAVIHLAAQTGVLPSVEAPVDDLAINAGGTLNLLEACRDAAVDRFTLASSNAVVGLVEPPIHEEMVQKPVSPYGVSKLAGESYCRSYAEIHGIRANALRFANVYGPGSRRKGSVVALFTRQALQSQGLTIYGDGDQTRDFLYIDDLVNGVTSLLESDLAGEIICLGTGIGTPVQTLANTIAAHYQAWSGRKLPITHAPVRAGETLRNYADPSKAQRLLNFAPQTDLEDGLAETWAWFVDTWLPEQSAA